MGVEDDLCACLFVVEEKGGELEMRQIENVRLMECVAISVSAVIGLTEHCE
jgi:hypothetical protein